MERGYYHPDVGYWQTVGKEPEPESLPEGTTNVPLRPSEHHKLIDGAWIYDDSLIEVTIDQINAERERRKDLPKIVSLSTGKAFPVDMKDGGRHNVSDLALCAVVKKSIADETTFKFTDADNVDQTLSNDEMIELGLQCAAQIMQIHEAARLIKAMDELPDDVSNDTYWLVAP